LFVVHILLNTNSQ